MPRLPPLTDLAAAIEALGPAAREKEPVMPIPVLLEEARDLANVLTPHRDLLAALVTFDVAALDAIPKLAELTQQRESERRGRRQGATGTPREGLRDEARRLRARLRKAATLLLAETHPDYGRVVATGRRYDLPNVAEDLRLLLRLADENPVAFARGNGLSPNVLQRAKEVFGELHGGGASGVARADASGDCRQAAALMALVVSELRAAATFLFRDDPVMLSRVASKWWARKREKRGTGGGE